MSHSIIDDQRVEISQLNTPFVINPLSSSTLTPTNGNLAHDINGTLYVGNNTSWNVINTGTTGTYVDLTSTQSITGQKTILNPIITGTGTIQSSSITNDLYYGNSATPGLVLGPGAGGTGATGIILGNDACGEIAITVGTGGTTGPFAIIATITLTHAAVTRPQPIISFTGVSTGTLTTLPIVGAGFQSSNSWAIYNMSATALSNGETYEWNYWVPCL